MQGACLNNEDLKLLENQSKTINKEENNFKTIEEVLIDKSNKNKEDIAQTTTKIATQIEIAQLQKTQKEIENSESRIKQTKQITLAVIILIIIFTIIAIH